MVNKILGRNIRKNRLAYNWTQEKLAETLHISHQLISKWENGITTPDIATLCSMASIFNVSLDDLCGIAPEQVESVIKEIEQTNLYTKITYKTLYAKWKEIEEQLIYYPTNDKLLYTALKFLRAMHDTTETDQQKEFVNAEILKISERLLDFSRNDLYRSYANYNLAVYYHEQVNLTRKNEQDIENAKKSKMHAELVLYKDMQKNSYHIFGATTIQEHCVGVEKALEEMLNSAKGACKNLIHFSNHFPAESNRHSEIYTDIYRLLEEITTKLPL